MFEHISNPTIFAHRGASVYAPENTLSAFLLAVKQGADAVELDAKLSLDGNVVVIHDQTIDRTTDGSGKVCDFTLSELKEFDAGGYFDDAFIGERIPTLYEVFDTVGEDIFINVEITNYASPFDNLPEIIAKLIRKHKLENNVLCSSFNPVALIRIKKELPEIQIGLLALPGFPGGWVRGFGNLLPINAVHPAERDTSFDLIQRFHRSGIQVNSYTINDADKMKSLFEWGVDGIFTDNPPLAQKELTKLRVQSPRAT